MKPPIGIGPGAAVCLGGGQVFKITGFPVVKLAQFASPIEITGKPTSIISKNTDIAIKHTN